MKHLTKIRNFLTSLYNSSLSFKESVNFSLLLIIFFSLIIFVTKPLILNIYNLAVILSEVNKVGENLFSRLEEVKKANDLLNSFDPTDLELVKTYMPTNPSPTSYFKNLENLAFRSGVSLDNMTTKNLNVSSNPSTYKELKMMSLNLNISGNFENIKKFINNLSFLGRHTELESFTYSVAQKEGSFASAKVGLKIYYLR